MKAIFVFITIACMIISSNVDAQTYSELIKDEIIAAPLNDITSKADVLIATRIRTDESLLQSDTIRKYFDNDDIAFLKQQIVALKSDTWKYPLFSKHSLINHNEVKLDKSNRPKKTIRSFSVPLFSTTMKRAVLIEAFFCGLLCGGGAFYIYEKKNDKWVMLSKYNEWAE